MLLELTEKIIVIAFSSLHTILLNCDNGSYICLTCHKGSKKNNLSCQAVLKDLFLKDIPNELI